MFLCDVVVVVVIAECFDFLVGVERSVGAAAMRTAAPRPVVVVAVARGGGVARGAKAAAAAAAVSLRSRRTAVGGVFMLGLGPAAAAAAAAPERELSKESPLVAELLRRSEANAEARKAELQNKNCVKLARMGVGDCAGLPDDTLDAFVAESERRIEAKRAETAAAAAAAADADAP